MSFTIAIDGPAGAGKSTIAKLVAKELECIYVDTGAMYRALALYMVRKGVDIHDEKKVEAELAGADVSLMYDKGELKVMLNGENVAGIIRTPEVSEAASVVSAYRQVRKELVRRQQLMACVLLILTAVCMSMQTYRYGICQRNEWVVCLTIACVLELYTAWRIPQELSKAKKS